MNGVSFHAANADDLPVLVRMLVDHASGTRRETLLDRTDVGYADASLDI